MEILRCERATLKCVVHKLMFIDFDRIKSKDVEAFNEIRKTTFSTHTHKHKVKRVFFPV